MDSILNITKSSLHTEFNGAARIVPMNEQKIGVCLCVFCIVMW